MFKYLSSKDDNPGFPDAVVLTNKSEHWLTIDADGRRIPPRSHAAMSSQQAESSPFVAEHVSAGLLVISGAKATQAPRSKKRKKQEAPETQDVTPEKPEQAHTVQAEPEIVIADTLVAEPEPQNWVSSNEDIVGLPTTDEI